MIKNGSQNRFDTKFSIEFDVLKSAEYVRTKHR